MDPDATWNGLCAALRTQDQALACERAGALLLWLDGGGFPPQQIESTELDDEARAFATRHSCLRMLQRAGGAP